MNKRGPMYSLAQLFISFVIPLVILVGFSSESQLGATKAFILALLFPLGFELYNILKYRKFSLFSLFAIIGIIATGAVTLFELSEGWLAARRSLPFILASAVLFVSILIKKPIIDALLPQIFDMKSVEKAAKQKSNWQLLQKKLRFTGYLLGFWLLLIAAASIILTLIIIKSPAGTEGFNSEYARLRVISLPIITLPLMVGVIALVMYVLTTMEKLTGIDAENLLKKKRIKK